MKTAMKKLFSLMLVAVLLVSTVPTAFAVETPTTCGDATHAGYEITPRPESEQNKAATCTEAGATAWRCHTPEGAEEKYGHVFTTEIPALGHDFSNGVCQRTGCGYTCPHSWDAGTVTKAATCTENGETTYVCAICGHNHIDNTKPASTGHDLDDITGACNNTGCDYEEPCSACGVTGHTAAGCSTNMCPYCFLDKADCDLAKCTVCNKCVMDGDHAACTAAEDHKGQVKVYLNLNYGDAYAYGEEMQYVWADRNALLHEVVGSVPAPNRDKHFFLYWTTDQDGTDIIDTKNTARATADDVMLYAHWADIIQSTKGKVDLIVNLNYGGKTETIENITAGTRMGDVLDNVGKPVRLYYKFVGWYWDIYCNDAVEVDDEIREGAEIFAKWQYRGISNEIMLKIYLNGNTKAVAKVVDMYSYSLDDDAISLGEVKEVVKKYYTNRNSDGLYFEGLFDTDSWSKYVRNSSSIDGAKYIDVDSDVDGEDTVVYVMVHNAKVRTSSSSSSSSSSSTADSSNPKTGDMIFTAVTIMGASAACLAALFYLNKKRSM